VRGITTFSRGVVSLVYLGDPCPPWGHGVFLGAWIVGDWTSASHSAVVSGLPDSRSAGLGSRSPPWRMWGAVPVDTAPPSTPPFGLGGVVFHPPARPVAGCDDVPTRMGGTEEASERPSEPARDPTLAFCVEADFTADSPSVAYPGVADLFLKGCRKLHGSKAETPLVTPLAF
jgi:hypothetical protein